MILATPLRPLHESGRYARRCPAPGFPDPRVGISVPRSVLQVLSILTLFVLAPVPIHAQSGGGDSGPYIHSAGPVFEIPAPEFATPTDMTYQVAFDVAVGSEGAEDLNQSLNSVARFLNMHGAAGVPVGRLEVAVVVHGTAAKDFLKAEAFREFTGYDNPNLELIEELAEFGVRFVMCGQSLGARSVPRDELVDPVQVALSAMTAHLVLQEEGYRVNPF
jgi:intracellular sulfur oxidation DsrE/DsrF family protein